MLQGVGPHPVPPVDDTVWHATCACFALQGGAAAGTNSVESLIGCSSAMTQREGFVWERAQLAEIILCKLCIVKSHGCSFAGQRLSMQVLCAATCTACVWGWLRTKLLSCRETPLVVLHVMVHRLQA
jgi:hypothetical protein